MMRSLTLPMLLLGLVACGDRAQAPEAAPAASTTTATGASAAPPAPGALVADGVIGFGGFGPAAFGAREEQVRMAWGRDLGEAKPESPDGCYYLMPQPVPDAGPPVAFMFEGARFVRMDVDVAGIQAPGGGAVGMDADGIRQHYGARVEARPHKYVQGGQYLRVPADDGSAGVLVFETDAGGRVQRWRVGVPPQVDYVEGCS